MHSRTLTLAELFQVGGWGSTKTSIAQYNMALEKSST